MINILGTNISPTHTMDEGTKVLEKVEEISKRLFIVGNKIINRNPRVKKCYVGVKL